MRSGRPALVVPFAHDQPDNAERVARLGSRGLSLRNATRRPVSPTNCDAYSMTRVRAAGVGVGEQVRREDGLRTACDALESVAPDGPPAEAAVN